MNPEQIPAQEVKSPIIEARDKYRKRASGLQRGVAEPQAAKYETNIYRLMERTGDNPRLINAMKKFIGALELKSVYGQPDELLPEAEAERLIRFFEEKAEELNSPDWNRK